MDWQATAKLMATALAAIARVVDGVAVKQAAEATTDYSAGALTAINTILNSVKSGELENLDPENAKEALDRLLALLTNSDTAADEAVADKFDNSPTD